MNNTYAFHKYAISEHRLLYVAQGPAEQSPATPESEPKTSKNADEYQKERMELFARHQRVLDTLHALEKQTGNKKYRQDREQYEKEIRGREDNSNKTIEAIIEKYGPEIEKTRSEKFVEVEIAQGTLREAINMDVEAQFKGKASVRDVMVDKEGNVFLFGTRSIGINIPEIQETADSTIDQLRTAFVLVWNPEWGKPKIDATGMIEKKNR